MLCDVLLIPILNFIRSQGEDQLQMNTSSASRNSSPKALEQNCLLITNLDPAPDKSLLCMELRHAAPLAFKSKIIPFWRMMSFSHDNYGIVCSVLAELGLTRRGNRTRE